MPKRTPDQPTRFVDRYRQRLNEEMQEQGATDRLLADKLAEVGYPIGFSAIYKTRTGNRQPAMDECYAIAQVLGYPNLDTFIDGPPFIQIARAANTVRIELANGWADTRNRVHEALYALSLAVREPGAVAAADVANPGWRDEFRDGMEHDLRWTMREQGVLWEETLRRIGEIFDDVVDVDDETRAEARRHKITGGER